MTKANRTFSEEQVNAMLDILETRQKHTPASTTLTAPALHGVFQGNTAQYGLFSSPGYRPEMFSTLVRPRSLAQLLGVAPSQYTNELLQIMTGVTNSSGTNAEGWCGDPPTVGQAKACRQTYSWGKYYVKTDLNAIPDLGELRNRADVPRDILNVDPASRNPFVPDIMYRLDDTRSVLRYEFWRLGVSLERSLEHVLLQGDTTLTSANAYHGFIAEFLGLDGQIKTGYADSETNVTCPAMDSFIITFGTDVGATIAGGDGRTITTAMSDMYWSLMDRAHEMGMEATQWAIVMLKEQFRRVVEEHSCTYATHRCASTNAGEPYYNDVQDTNALRLQMMHGQYILIDNVAVPVIFSEGIPRESLGSNRFYSDMYFVPVSWNGMPLLRLEYFPMNNQYAKEFANFQGEEVGIINNGMFIVGSKQTAFCKEYHFATKLRLILETPWLAGRIDNIEYEFRASPRNADPNDTFFYANGGYTYATS